MILVTGGCSFSQVGDSWGPNWPLHLKQQGNFHSAIHTGKGSSDNTTIKRQIIQRVWGLLEQGIPAKDILVGVMWSGSDRHSAYLDYDVESFYQISGSREENSLGKNPCSYKNPLSISLNGYANQYLISPGWQDQLSLSYYNHLHSQAGGHIRSLENVLALQWFLKHHGVQFFMTEYSYHSIHMHVHPDHHADMFQTAVNLAANSDIQDLLSQVDHDHWLPVENMNAWVDSHGFEYPNPGDYHPSAEAQERFTTDVIIPFLNTKEIL